VHVLLEVERVFMRCNCTDLQKRRELLGRFILVQIVANKGEQVHNCILTQIHQLHVVSESGEQPCLRLRIAEELASAGDVEDEAEIG